MINENDVRLQRALGAMRALRKRVEELEAERREPIAIVGMACRFPGAATSLDEYWRLLEGGQTALGDLEERFDTALLSGVPRRAGLLRSVADFDPGVFGMAPREASALDPQQRLLLEVAWEALEHAGYAPTSVPRQPAGVFIGLTSVDFRELYEFGSEALDAHAATGATNCFAAGRIAYTFGFEGPAVVVDTACSSSLVAVHLACQSLRSGESALALAGGANVILSALSLQLVAKTGALAPDGVCRAFDAAANGFARGEGAGIVVLKRLRDAIADGDQICAVIRGSAVNQDGRSLNLTSPNGEAQARLVRQAVESASVSPSDVTYVEAHGTGTILGDPIELEALREILGAGDERCCIGSVKSNLGHLEAAAGVAGLIKVVLSMQHGSIPKQPNFERLNPRIALAGSRLAIPTETVPWAPRGRRIAGVSSFGMSGTNAHVVLEEAPPPGPPPQRGSRSFHLLALSARTPEALTELARRYRDDLERRSAEELPDVCHTANVGRAQFRYRIAVTGDSPGALVQGLEAVLVGSGTTEATAPADGGGIAFLFTGQGSAYAGMGRELYAADPEFRSVLDASDAILRPHLEEPLLSVLFPAEGAPTLLYQTLYAQPALFALEYALAKFWISAGIRPKVVLGHSVGEYVAACIAGVLTFEDGLRLMARRGALMHSTEPGAMVAVFAGSDAIAEDLALFTPDLSIAALNAPNTVVVSGSVTAVSAFRARLEQRGIRHKQLAVSRAFHSPLMDPILDELEREARQLEYSPGNMTLISNVTARAFSEDHPYGASYIRSHARAPVKFADSIRAALACGCRTFLEVGPSATLVGLTRQIVGKDLSVRLVASLGKGKSSEKSVLDAAGVLYSHGHDLELLAFERGGSARRVALPTYPFQRKSYWSVPRARAPRDGALTAGPHGAALGARPNERTASAGRAEPFPSVVADEHAVPAPCSALLPSLEPATERHEQPASLERALFGCVARVLRMAASELHASDSLRSLGLDSLLALELREAVAREFGVHIDLVALLDAVDLSSLAARLRESIPDDGGLEPRRSGALNSCPIVLHPEARHERFPLTDLQQAYLVGRTEAFALGGTSTYFLLEFDLDGADLCRIERSLQRLIERHGMLRATVSPHGDQRVLDDLPDYRMKVTDLRGRTAAAQERELAAIREQMSAQLFDTERGPLFDVRVTLKDSRSMRLHLGVDALIVDAWSVALLFREWAALYHGGDALPELELTYRDYVLYLAAREATPEYQRSLAYWRDRLSSLPPAPDLPLAKNPEAIRAPKFVRRTARLGAEALRRLKDNAATTGVTVSAAVCAAYAEVLALWAKSSRFTLNLLVLNRAPVHPEVSCVVGNFSATLLLEVDVALETSFAERASRLQRQLLTDLEHQAVSGVRVLRELNAESGGVGRVSMPVVFASTLNFGAQHEKASFRLDLGESSQPVHASLRTPQVWLDHQVVEDEGELRLNWDAVEELFPPGMVDDMFATYTERLEQLAGDVAVWRGVGTASIPASHLAVRAAANQTAAPLCEDLLHAPFVDMARQHPDGVAIICPDRTLSYGELDDLSERVAVWLRDQGVGRESPVPIVMRKGWQQMVGALAALKAGGAYVPIDPGLPRERLEHLLQHTQARCLLTHDAVARGVDWASNLPCFDVDDALTLPRPELPLPRIARPDDIAYIIYTSGSTGMPKGVMIDHRAALNTILDVNDRLLLGPEDRVFGLSAFSFDLSVFDVFGTLAAGAALVLPRPEHTREPARWLEQLLAQRVTVWNTVPALMEMMVDHLAGLERTVQLGLREVMLSGDSIQVTLPERIWRVAAAARCYSLGGATEASIWSIWYPIVRVDPSWSSIPYGKPMRNQRFEVLDAHLQPRPLWVPGEIYIAGDGLARGYFRDAAKTAASFITHPRTGERLYRTGDLGRYLPDGNIEFLGREDFQVKIRGYRVELGEVEAALGQLRSVRAAVAVALGERGAKRLVAYVVMDPDEAVSEEGMLETLARKLPAYAVPSRVVVLSELPLTRNGKIDRKMLPDPGAVPSLRVRMEPTTSTERALFAMWTDLLKHSEFGTTDEFFSLGGQSLLAVRLMGRVSQELGVALPLSTLFESPTIRALAARIDASSAATRREPLVKIRSSGRDRPWFFVHPVGGDVLCYAELAQALGDEQGFYALQSPDRDARADTIGAMAEMYETALRKVQARGPYRIGGWSMGGVVAHEIAQRLRRVAEPVELLALIDVSIAPEGGARPEASDGFLLEAFVRDLGGLARTELSLGGEDYAHLPLSERLACVLDRARALGALPEQTDSASLRSYFERFCVNYRAMLAHRAQAYDGAQVFIRAADEGAPHEVAVAWSALARNAEILDVPGDHYAITRPSGARAIAGALRARTSSVHVARPHAPASGQRSATRAESFDPGAMSD